MSGEEFLNKLYKDLNLSDEVKHTASGSRDKNEAVARYMERLSKTHEQATKKEHRIELLKQLYYNKYVVKENDIPKYRDKERIIQGQKDSLDRWLDYLLDDNAVYPMWAKYWVFQGMLKIGTYDEANGTYQKRSKKTLAPFVEANPEVIARCINLVIDSLGKKELDDNGLEQLVESGNFSKLYTILLKKQKENMQVVSESTDGVWVTYHYETAEEANKKEITGIEPEYLKLYNSLQGYNTGWCTAGGKEIAKDQICGCSGYLGGDFHVYYTKDNNNEYKIPRIAIRMVQQRIGEIRGVAEGQNIEDGFEDIVKEKIGAFQGITEDVIKNYLEIIDNMKYLTLLNKKNASNQEFTKEDIKFIYEINKEIYGFGWEKDPRIKKIISQRNREKDASQLTDKQDIIKFFCNHYNYKEFPDNLKNDREFVLEAVKHDYLVLSQVSTKLKNDKEIILEAVKKSLLAFKYASPKLKKDKDIALEVVKYEEEGFLRLPPELQNDPEIVLAAVKASAMVLIFASNKFQNDPKFMLEAVRQNGEALRYASPELQNEKKFVLEAIKENSLAFHYISAELKNNQDFILEAKRQISDDDSSLSNNNTRHK